MVEQSPVRLEVYVQDYFFDADATQAGEKEGTHLEGDRSAPISTNDWETWFQTWMMALHPHLSPTYQSQSQEYELSLRLTTDAEIQSLNAQYRHKDQPTDVLAFAALEVDYPDVDYADDADILEAERPFEPPLYLGDIVISVETAEQQAFQQHHSLQQELAWLAAHGLLHLLGWDHPDDESLEAMLHQQEQLLQTVGLR
jgi:probable rRNA maturation factor